MEHTIGGDALTVGRRLTVAKENHVESNSNEWVCVC
jgi:hypothetical protein